MKRLLQSLQYTIAVYAVLITFLAIFFILHHTTSEFIHLSHTDNNNLYNLPLEDQKQLCDYPMSYRKPLYRSLQEYTQVQLIFFRKMKMAVAVEVCHKRGWIVRRTAHTMEELDQLLNHRDIFSILFTSSKELSSPLMDQYTNNSRILAAGIPDAYLFTGTKKEQYITFQRFLGQYHCSIEQINFMPSSFLMDNVKQCNSFLRHLKQNGHFQMWVLKKSQGFGGDGITVISNITLLQNMFSTCPSNKQYIMQQYIQNMLLLNRRKFDIRALVVVANTNPYMIFYHEGYLRVVMSQFDSNGSREVHLTNTHVQSMQANFNPDDHFWSFSKFQSYLDKHYPDNDKFVTTKLVPHIQKISVFILKAGKVQIINMCSILIVVISGRHLMKRAPSSYQLLGLDLMITLDWHIWFIEANNYPLWPKGGWISNFTSQMGVSIKNQ